MNDETFEKARGLKQEIKRLEGSITEIKNILNDAHLYGITIEMVDRWLQEFKSFQKAEIIKLQKEYDEL